MHNFTLSTQSHQQNTPIASIIYPNLRSTAVRQVHCLSLEIYNVREYKRAWKPCSLAYYLVEKTNKPTGSSYNR